MKSIITKVLVTLGIIFLILVVVGVYLFVADPFGIKPLIFGVPSPIQNETVQILDSVENNDMKEFTEDELTAETAPVGFKLSVSQVEALVSFGIDPSSVPTTISSEQEKCFVRALGEAKVAEVKAGAVPSALEFLRAKACI